MKAQMVPQPSLVTLTLTQEEARGLQAAGRIVLPVLEEGDHHFRLTDSVRDLVEALDEAMD